MGELDPKQTTVQELGLYMAGAKRMDMNGKEERGAADALWIEAPGQAARCVPPCTEYAKEDEPDALPGACHAQIIAEQSHHQHQDTAHRQADDNGEQGCQH